MIDTLFKTYPTDIAQHVIDAMAPGIEAEIKRVHEAVEAALLADRFYESKNESPPRPSTVAA